MTRLPLIAVLGMIAIAGCAKEKKDYWGKIDPVTPDTPEVTDESNPEIVKLGWTNVSLSYGELPSHISVYKSPTSIDGNTCIAYIAVADMNKGGNFEVLGDIVYCDDASVKNYGAVSTHTPAQFYEQSKAPVIINAGLFFYAPKSDKTPFYSSQNLVVRDGSLLAINQNYYSEDWQTIWYPTIGVFCRDKGGKCFTTWTYTTGGVTYSYPAPADNDINKDPLQAPSATFPSGAKDFSTLNVANAIGGIGVLVKDGSVMNTWKQEMLNVSADSRQPRTAIGSTNGGKLIFFVCEGRNKTEGVAGMTTAEVASVMLSLGCNEALNLDGGGSTCMVINGKDTIKPSDGKQRSVLTALKMY